MDFQNENGHIFEKLEKNTEEIHNNKSQKT